MLRKATDDAVGREIQKILSLLQPLPALTGRFSKSSQAATRHIEPALRAGNESTQALLEAIGPVIRYLHGATVIRRATTGRTWDSISRLPKSSVPRLRSAATACASV